MVGAFICDAIGIAAQAIACLRDPGAGPDDARVNPGGGAIALIGERM